MGRVVSKVNGLFSKSPHQALKFDDGAFSEMPVEDPGQGERGASLISGVLGRGGGLDVPSIHTCRFLLAHELMMSSAHPVARARLMWG